MRRRRRRREETGHLDACQIATRRKERRKKNTPKGTLRNGLGKKKKEIRYFLPNIKEKREGEKRETEKSTKMCVTHFRAQEKREKEYNMQTLGCQTIKLTSNVLVFSSRHFL